MGLDWLLFILPRIQSASSIWRFMPFFNPRNFSFIISLNIANVIPGPFILIFLFYNFCLLYIEPYFIVCLHLSFKCSHPLMECCILINFLRLVFQLIQLCLACWLVHPFPLQIQCLCLSFPCSLFKSVSSFSNLFHSILLLPYHFYSSLCMFKYFSISLWSLSACPITQVLRDDFSICCICWLSFTVDSFLVCNLIGVFDFIFSEIILLCGSPVCPGLWKWPQRSVFVFFNANCSKGSLE